MSEAGIRLFAFFGIVVAIMGATIIVSGISATISEEGNGDAREGFITGLLISSIIMAFIIGYFVVYGR